MELFGSNINLFRRREATPPVSTTTDPNAASNHPAVGSGSYEEKVVRVANPQTSLTVSAVYRAVELKAKTIGSMEMQYQRKDSERGNFVPSMYGEGRVLNWLLQKRANPIMTGCELFQQMSIAREMQGNAFVYIERDEVGTPINLWLAWCGGYDYATNTYTLTYNTDHGMRSKFQAPAEDVIHWKNTFRRADGYMGIPTHVYAIQTLSQIATQKQLALETAAKGGRMKAFIGEQQPTSGYNPIGQGLFDPKQMKNYAKEINEEIYKQDIVSLRGLDKVVPISMSAQDMQMMEMLGVSLDDCARYYATPRPLLMLDTNSHYNDYTNATMEYLQRTIAPLARELEDLFEAKFLTAGDFGNRRFHMCEIPLLRMDLERQAKVDQLNLQTGAKTINEIRAEHDMPSVENGNEPLASANLMTLKALIAKSDAATQLNPGTYTVQSNNDGNGEEKGN
jgi:HK97 family phage portal protein